MKIQTFFSLFFFCILINFFVFLGYDLKPIIMKRITIIILLLLVAQAIIFSQGCLPEGITFTTQQQIDDFQTNYPGCTEIEGDVEISGDDISNLSS